MTTWSRAEQIRALDQDFDVVVIGGGVVGAGAALDARTRGLKVAVIDRDDWASATSSRSTKLLHGGVRYLSQLRFGLIREGLREQKVLARTADYLFTPFDFVIPVFRDRGFADAPRWARNPRVFPIAMRMGLWFYDRLGARPWRVERKIDREELLRRFPRLKPDSLRHGVIYRDAKTDDARLTLMLAKTAVSLGGVAANHVEAMSVERTDGGFVIHARDRLRGGALDIQTRTVIAATGPMAPPPGGTKDPMSVVLSKGAHLVADLDDLGLADSALVLPETEDARVMFLVPWQGMGIIGTTDTPYDGDPEHPVTDSADTSYLLRHVHEYLDLDDFEPVSAWSGLRALAAGGSGSTAKVSRAHKLVELAPGYVQVAGGKLTGYRRIATQVVNRVAKRLGSVPNTRTPTQMIEGAGISDELRVEVDQQVTDLGLPPSYSDELLDRYGTNSVHVLEIAAASADHRTVIADRWTLAEVAYAVRSEGAATITDFVQRRTRLAWFTRDHAASVLEPIGKVMAAECGWDEERLGNELARVRADLAAEGL